MFDKDEPREDKPDRLGDSPRGGTPRPEEGERGRWLRGDGGKNAAEWEVTDFYESFDGFEDPRA